MTLRLCGIGDEAGWSVEEQVDVLAGLGLGGIELRSVGGVPLDRLGDAGFEAVCDAVEGAELQVVALDSKIGDWSKTAEAPFEVELAELSVLADRARRLRAPYLRVMSYPRGGLGEERWREEVLRRMRTLASAAEQLGVVLLHENCVGWGSQGAASTLEMLEEVGSPALRVLFDVGNPVVYGYDPLDYLRQVLPWVEHVHVKDAVATAGEDVFTLPGRGDARLVECLRLLRDSGYRGYLSLEPHLAHIPHLGVTREGAAEAFASYAREFEALLARIDAAGASLG